jgi:hypothetical protein
VSQSKNLKNLNTGEMSGLFAGQRSTSQELKISLIFFLDSPDVWQEALSC